MLRPCAKVYWINAEPRLPLQFRRPNPEFPALFDPPRYLGMQLLGLSFFQVCAPISNADCRHRRLTRRLELRMSRHHGIKVFCLAHIVVNPLPDLICSVTLETHPHLQPAKTSRLLETVNIVLVSFMGTVEFVREIGRLHSKGCRQAAIILY